MFERFSDEGLAQRSYLIACDRTRQAVIVDPRRDIDAYIATARRLGLTIVTAIETHIHADFVSGAHELAALGIRVVTGPGAGLRYEAHEAADGEVMRVGDITLEFLHTPGHTPEHISILVREPGQPRRVLTGDTLFVGAVGRPDLLGEDVARGLAEQLYDSLFHKLLLLDDDVEVHPGHGAGSLCGAGIGKEPHSTIGQERRFNAILQEKSREAFVAAVLADLPETPPYFPRMKRINKEGPPVLGLNDGVPAPQEIRPTDAVALVKDGALLLDLRSSDAFGDGHPAGALNIGFGARIGYWAGWVVPPDVRILLLVSDPRQGTEVVRQLLRVGLDNVAGFVSGGYAAWDTAGGQTERLRQIDARELRDRLARGDRVTVVDVRSPGEWRTSHIEGSINLPVGELTGRVGELDKSSIVATICESGFRSSLASSLLQRAGFQAVNVSDGTAAYRALEGRMQA